MTKWALAAVLLCAGVDLAACPLCLGAFQSSTAQQLVEARGAAIALPVSGGYRVMAVIKGEKPAGGFIDAGAVRLKGEESDQRKPVLLVRDESSPTWIGIGSVGREYANWLRQLAASKRPAQTSGDWQTRVALIVPQLESPEQLVAEIAYAELAVAPYSALTAVRARIAATAVRRWIADPSLAARQPLYLLLLGVAGDERDALVIEQRVEAQWQSGNAMNVGPLLAADLQLRGPTRIGWIESKYLTDPKRSTQEVEAALLALSVHANTDDALLRERVIRSYRAFIRARPDIAGFVANDLANWRHWDAVPEYVALMKSDVRQQYASRVAIAAYLLRSPGGAQGIDLRPNDLRASASSPMPARASKTAITSQ